MPDKPVVYRIGKKVVGTLEDTLFWKNVDRDKHYMKAHHGWAWDYDTVLKAWADGARTLEIRDLKNNIRYRASTSKFFAKGVKISYGYGVQMLLIDKYWTEYNDRQPTLFDLEDNHGD